LSSKFISVLSSSFHGCSLRDKQLISVCH
jgi:hypothetical protein